MAAPAQSADNAPENLVRLEKHRWIAEHVKGKTFADVGGLWGTVNETVTIAALNGASETTMIDIQPLGSKWWKLFDERCRSLGVDDCKPVIADICNANISNNTGQFDITHCSGVLYHASDPVAMIRNLISITRERFVLSSMLVPSRISNSAGTLEIGVGEIHCVPALRGKPKEIFARHFDERELPIKGINAPEPVFVGKNGRLRTGPWWNLFTAETMLAMCEIFDVTIENTWISKQGAQSILARINNRPD